jgi:hypothetical protein
MTIHETILQTLASWRPEGPAARLSIDHADSGWQVSLLAERVDTVACRLRALGLTRLRPASDAVPLAEQAARIANRMTGLLEGLCLVEVDVEHGVALLRSPARAQGSDGRVYYELLRHADGTTFVGRYQSAPGGRRQAVPFTLTHEGLAKLVGACTVSNDVASCPG